MTEQALLPGAGGVDDNSAGNRRAVILAAVAGGLALLVAVYFLFFTGGSDEALGSGPVIVPKAAAKTAPKAAAKKPAAKKVVPATFTGVHARDPFKPLIDPPPPAPVAPVVVPAFPDSSSGGTVTTPAQTLHLTSLATGAVKVEVNSTPYAPKVGEKFATYFQLLKLQGTSCATFLYGDESFDLCKGNSVTKQ